MADTGVVKAVFNDAILTSGSALDHVVSILSSEMTAQFRDERQIQSHLAETRPSLSTLTLEGQEQYTQRRIAYIDGEPRLDYDPSLGVTIRSMSGKNLSLVQMLGSIKIETLLIYGECSIFRNQEAFHWLIDHSSLISIIQDFPGGHPPLLNDLAQVSRILDFINPAELKGV